MSQPRFHLVRGDGVGAGAAAHDGRYWCRGCDGDVLASSLEIVSRHPTSEGVLEYVRCSEGHLGMRRRLRASFDDASRSTVNEDAG